MSLRPVLIMTIYIYNNILNQTVRQLYQRNKSLSWVKTATEHEPTSRKPQMLTAANDLSKHIILFIAGTISARTPTVSK